jgi:hypothetical protein
MSWLKASAVVIGLVCAYSSGFGSANDRWLAHWAERDASDARAALSAEAENRKEEQANQLAIAGIRDDADKQIAAAHADAVNAMSAADGLQSSLAALRRQLADSETGRVTAIASKRAAEAHASILLAELLSEADRMAGEYAAEAVNTRIAGAACERAYDAATGK